MIPCPEGKFCPHKSAEPWIECSGCAEGSVELSRDTFGIIVCSMGVFVLILAIAMHYCYRHRKYLLHLARQVGPMSIQKKRKESQAQLHRLKPMLDIIAKRLDKLEGMASHREESQVVTSSSKTTSDGTQNMIQLDGEKTSKFDANRIYDCLDTDNYGELSVEELNSVLGLEKLELKNFVKRMQELGGAEDKKTHVTRSVFVKHFLQVLEENIHLNVTSEEANSIYDDILAEMDSGSNTLKENMLYGSSYISRILTEQQIYVLIKVSIALLNLPTTIVGTCLVVVGLMWNVCDPFRNSGK
jgi:hypothetical protein